ncbi:hypothetical protein V6Z11_A01G210000 [Gossypium hirsutum]
MQLFSDLFFFHSQLFLVTLSGCESAMKSLILVSNKY